LIILDYIDCPSLTVCDLQHFEQQIGELQELLTASGEGDGTKLIKISHIGAAPKAPHPMVLIGGLFVVATMFDRADAARSFNRKL
jgi:hypothetical protein